MNEEFKNFLKAHFTYVVVHNLFAAKLKTQVREMFIIISALYT